MMPLVHDGSPSGDDERDKENCADDHVSILPKLHRGLCGHSGESNASSGAERHYYWTAETFLLQRSELACGTRTANHQLTTDTAVAGSSPVATRARRSGRLRPIDTPA